MMIAKECNFKIRMLEFGQQEIVYSVDEFMDSYKETINANPLYFNFINEWLKQNLYILLKM